MPLFHRSDEALPFFILGAACYLVLVFLVLWRSRSMEFKLICSGILTAVYAVWCSAAFSGSAPGMQVQAGQAGVFIGSGTVGVLSRIAVLLILGGLGATIANLWTRLPLPSPSREEGIRANPQ